MKNLKTYVSALAVSSVSTLVLAGSPAATTAPAADATTKTADSLKPQADAARTMAKTETISGKVVSVNADARTIKLASSMKGADGKETSKEVELTWSETTKLAWKNDKMTAATATDLKMGTEITVKSEARDGKTVASEIWLHPVAAAAQPATK